MNINGTFATVNSHGGVDYTPMDAGVTPAFFVEAIKDDAASERDGRPIFRERECVALMIAGDPNSRPVHPISESLFKEKPWLRVHYERWKSNLEPLKSGTPLSQWAPMTPAKLHEFEALDIRSVEDLAGWPDYAIGRMPDGRQWRDKAKAWLNSAAGSAEVLRLVAENDRMREELAELRKTQLEMRASMDLPQGSPVSSDVQAAEIVQMRADMAEMMAVVRAMNTPWEPPPAQPMEAQDPSEAQPRRERSEEARAAQSAAMKANWERRKAAAQAGGEPSPQSGAEG